MLGALEWAAGKSNEAVPGTLDRGNQACNYVVPRMESGSISTNERAEGHQEKILPVQTYRTLF